jgi:two-component system cell cycle response regulator
LERTWELNEANKRLESLATTDVVTGLPNHRSLVNALDAEVSRCTTAQATCAVLFIDLDYFKALNDSFGHAVGDNVLREFGEILQGALGDKGVCGRWGGEEFVCILPNSNHDDAIEIAESIRRIAAQHSFKLCMSCHLTCSIGVAIFPKDGSNQSSLAESADKAMYVAKSLGRNQVRAAQDVSSSFVSLHSDSVSREDQALTGLVEALASLVRIRDSSTGNCINDVEDLAKQIAVELKLTPSDIRLIGIAGKLHDIGKVAISDAILTKTDPLTPDEWALMKQHATIGAEVVARVPSLRAIAPGIRSHHEQWDGGGYPDGLIGAEIPLAAQIVSVADCFSAITSDRPYHQGLSGEEALAKIRQSSGSKFSPDVVSALEGVIGRSRSLSAA